MKKYNMDTNRILKLALEESIYRTIMESKMSDKCIDDFGNELFGEYRGKKEPDTKIEIRYFDKLWGFVDNNKKHPKLKTALMHLKECTKEYPEILKPDSNIIYRGAAAKDDLKKKLFITNLKSLEKFLSYPTKNIKGQKWALVDKSYKYNPTFEVQSWSTKISVAENFTPGGGSYIGAMGFSKAMVIYQAKVGEKELLFNTKFMNKISRDTIGSNEYEILRIGKSLNVEAWVCVSENVVGELIDEKLFRTINYMAGITNREFKTIVFSKELIGEMLNSLIDFLVKSGYKEKELREVFSSSGLLSDDLINDLKYLIKFVRMVEDY